MKRRITVVAVAGALLCIGSLAATGGPAFAEVRSAASESPTLQLTTGADPVESLTTRLGATGVLGSSSSDGVMWSVHPAGGSQCGPSLSGDEGHIATAEGPIKLEPKQSSSGSQAYSTTSEWTPEAAGSYLLCGWLGVLVSEINGGRNVVEIVAQTSLPFTVRPPHLSVSLSVPKHVRIRQKFQVTTKAQAEAVRSLYEYMLPDRGGCPGNAALASSTAHVIDPSFDSSAHGNIWQVNGGPSSRTYSESVKFPGSWIVCAYYQYHGLSTTPEGTASAAFTALASHQAHKHRHGHKRRG